MSPCIGRTLGILRHRVARILRRRGQGRQLLSAPTIPPCPCLLLQVPWESPVGGGLLLSGSGTQPQKGAAEVGAADAVAGKRLRRYLDVNNVIHGSSAGSPVVWVGDMGYVPVYW